jgi:hypothetical protein
MLVQRLSLGLFIIPLITVFACLGVAIAFNVYEPCNPFINGCYTISRIGRSHPGVLIFKPMMLITVIMIIAYSFEHVRIFKKFLISKIYLNLILLFGLVSAACLFTYILFLGVEGSEVWKFMRRGGIFIYIISLVFSQFFIALSYMKIKDDYQVIVSFQAIKVTFYHSFFVVIFGFVLFLFTNRFLQLTTWNTRIVIEWNYFLFMSLFFLNTYFVWKKINATN